MFGTTQRRSVTAKRRATTLAVRDRQGPRDLPELVMHLLQKIPETWLGTVVMVVSQPKTRGRSLSPTGPSFPAGGLSQSAIGK